MGKPTDTDASSTFYWQDASSTFYWQDASSTFYWQDASSTLLLAGCQFHCST
ncbi:MAG: hypothetical protein F6J86_23855 [Symploca sp. SIO1B1]|nr:hypothetical protein [Symploca sp. SIO1B1]